MIFDKILNRIIDKYPQSKRWIVLMESFTLPGFENVPVYDVFKFFIKEINKGTLPTRAKSIAFSFFLAVFPFIIFLFTLIPYIPIESFQDSILRLVKEIMPNQSSYQFISTTIEDVVNNPRGGLLSLNIILALFFSANGVVAMIDSFDKAHSIFKRRNFFQTYWVAFKITGLLLLMFIFSILLIIAGRVIYIQLLDWLALDNTGNFKVLFEIARYLVILLLFFFSISLIFYYGPATTTKWRFITLGSTVTTILSIFLSVGFSYYVTNLVEYNKFYGSIGTIILMMIWIYLNSFVLLIGFELNTSIYYHKSLRLEQDGEE